jgi:hypothetical protein
METIKIKKSQFSAISINRITAERFRTFSKKIATSHSSTLDDMMDFFEATKISPRNKMMRNYLGLYNYLILRLDYIVELIREQEQKYHKPTYELLAGLFKQAERMEAKAPPLEENNISKLTREERELEEEKISLKDYNLLKKARKKDREEFSGMLSKIINGIEEVKPTFGKPYRKIEIDFNELHILKRRYQKW